MTTTSRLMKRPIKKRGHHSNKGFSRATTINSLPKDLLITNVVARVASHSFTDLINMKKSCKDFLDAAEDSFAYQHVSLHNFPLIPWPTLDDKKISFLKRCKESKNMDTLYREGLLQYYMGNMGGEGGLEMLKIVSQKGHKEAKYVYGMIMLCSENEELRKQGLQHMRFLRESKCVIRCRMNVKNILRYVWKYNKMLVRNQRTLCQSKSTCKRWKPKQGRWLLLEDEDDDNDDINMCEYCRWDHELDSFYELFHVH